MDSKCLRSRELFADLVDATLAPPLERQLRAHLEDCPDCASLLVSYREVVAALRTFASPDVSGELTRKILARTPRRERAPRVLAPPFPASWAARAAALAAAAVLVLLVWRPPEFLGGVSNRVSLRAHQAYSFSVRSYHQTARWLSELNVLRMTVGVAFEDRLDRLNERLQDLDEARRRSNDDPASEQSKYPTTSFGERASSKTSPFSSQLS